MSLPTALKAVSVALALILASPPAVASAPPTGSFVGALRNDPGGGDGGNGDCLGLTWRAAVGGTIGCAVGILPSFAYLALATALVPAAVATHNAVGQGLAILGMVSGSALGAMMWAEGGMAGRWQQPAFWIAAGLSALVRFTTILAVGLSIKPNQVTGEINPSDATGAIATMLILPALVEAAVLSLPVAARFFAVAPPQDDERRLAMGSGGVLRDEG